MDNSQDNSSFDRLTEQFINRAGTDCAYITASKRQKIFYLLVAIGMLFFLKYRWDYFLMTITMIMAFWYFAAVIFRCSAAALSLLGRGERRVSDAALSIIKDDYLPVYTIFLPLYREANIVNKILRNMESLDYPKDKLDVKLLLENDDQMTIDAVNQCQLPPYCEVIIIPGMTPKTKPRACNYGLERARGEFCVIFDAEDRPEPDQLKKAWFVFYNSPQNLICVQAKLNYENSRFNWLTRFFTVEYSTSFDLLLPGLSTMRVPLPLGGTSNHFRTEKLRECGGWDPFNVTEDCDLGVRIYTAGFVTCVLDSTTWEEANSQIWNWVRQRSRWVKGFLQTHLVHTRHPLRTWKQLGTRGFLGFYLSVGASSFMMLVNVFFWAAGLIYSGLLWHALAHGETLSSSIIGPQVFSGYKGFELGAWRLHVWPLFYWGADENTFWAGLSVLLFGVSMILLLANLFFVAIHIAACLKRRYYFLIPTALLMPFYWLLISFGAWKGFIQLFTNPFYWEKTHHGLTPADQKEKP
ncbi:MAG: glycosyltransferase [Victivallaceae bacterium]|nr:glycosyltransferase [Victivallaceae bacterium]